MGATRQLRVTHGPCGGLRANAGLLCIEWVMKLLSKKQGSLCRASSCRRSRGRGRPGGTLGGLAVGDSGPLHGPDRRAPKHASTSALTRLSTAFHSVPQRAPRHRCRCGIYNAESTPTQLRRTHTLSLALAFAPPAKEARTLLLRDRSNHPLVLQNLLSSWTFLRIFGKDPLDEFTHL